MRLLKHFTGIQRAIKQYGPLMQYDGQQCRVCGHQLPPIYLHDGEQPAMIDATWICFQCHLNAIDERIRDATEKRKATVQLLESVRKRREGSGEEAQA